MPRGRKAKATEEKKADVIVTEEVNENVAAEAVETEEVKEETAEAEVSVQEEESAPKKRGRKPNTAKAEPKETPKKRGRKPAAEKAEVKETAPKEAEANIVLQFDFGEFVSKDLVEKCKQAYKAENKTKIKSIDIYVKPSDKKAYYVVNDKSAGYVDLEN
ncbi:MAG: hypothetical protein K2N61_08050 [Lachnospiraceae bacterium]|nr:hypothetical protein [Lachnospiraceae bacterium]